MSCSVIFILHVPSESWMLRPTCLPNNRGNVTSLMAQEVFYDTSVDDIDRHVCAGVHARDALCFPHCAVGHNLATSRYAIQQSRERIWQGINGQTRGRIVLICCQPSAISWQGRRRSDTSGRRYAVGKILADTVSYAPLRLRDAGHYWQTVCFIITELVIGGEHSSSLFLLLCWKYEL